METDIMKSIIYSLLIAGTLVSSSTINAMESNKRKYKEEKEKEAETPREIKRPRLEEEAEKESNLQQEASALIDAIIQLKNEKSLEALLEKHFYLPIEIKDSLTKQINSPNSMGETLLHTAENRYQVQALLSFGADPNLQSHLLQNPWHSMLAQGNVDAAETFLKILNIEPFIAFDRTDFTTLHYAIMNNALSFVQKILDNADPANQQNLTDILNYRGLYPDSILIIAAVHYCPACLEKLIARGANIGITTRNQGSTPLLEAARSQPIAVYEMLLNKSNSLNLGNEHDDVDMDNIDALGYAVQGNNYELVSYIVLNKKYDVNPPLEDYFSKKYIFSAPLGMAFENYFKASNSFERDKIEKIIEFLIQQGANITIRSIHETPLLIYVLKKLTTHPDKILLAYFLINAGAHVNIISREKSKIDPNRTTKEYPLAALIFNDYDQTNEQQTISSLLNENDNQNKEDKQNVYTLIKNLINKGAKIRQRDKDIIMNSGNKPLIEAIIAAPVFNDEQELSQPFEIMKEESDSEEEEHESPHTEKIPSEKTAINPEEQVFRPKDLRYQAARKFVIGFLKSGDDSKMRRSYDEIVSEMKEYISFIVNETNSMDRTLLHNAKTPVEVERLIFLGATPVLKSKMGQTPFMSMIAQGNSEAAETLLTFLREKSHLYADKTGLLTVHYALMANAVSLVKRIVDNTEKINKIINKLRGGEPGVTPLILATLYCPDAIKLLINKGANINKVNQDGVPPFLFAALKQPENVLDLLIQAGANKDVVDNDNHNALFYAIQGNNKDIIRYLIEKLKLNPTIRDEEDSKSSFDFALDHIHDPHYHDLIIKLLPYIDEQTVAQLNLNLLIPQAYSNTNLLNKHEL